VAAGETGLIGQHRLEAYGTLRPLSFTVGAWKARQDNFGMSLDNAKRNVDLQLFCPRRIVSKPAEFSSSRLVSAGNGAI
jgi:hypothetical protein